MTAFIYCNGKLINLNLISKIEPNDGPGYRLSTEQGVVDRANLDIGELAIEVIPTDGEWEYLSAVQEDNGTLSILREPVIAFAKNVFGMVGPIVPTKRTGIFGYCAIRKIGAEPVFADGTSFPNAEAWLEYEQEAEILRLAS